MSVLAKWRGWLIYLLEECARAEFDSPSVAPSKLWRRSKPRRAIAA
jgi:hypothetical protein